ncbi:MAG: AAA family ATPase, partial [Actinomycetota bacterium]|nr:AAA family ATPase [Actinomycetota bacterium]
VARLEELRLNAFEEWIDADLALRRHTDVVPELERLVREHPLRERFHAQLMLTLYRSGRQADALDAYQRARRALSELGLEPGTGLRELQRRILEHDPTLELPPEPRMRLPLPPTPLLGRDRELADATTLLLRSDVRVVTLVSTGGAGKTRLALELARRNGGRFRDGVVYVPLAALTDASLVLPTIARGFELPESARKTPIETVAEHLAERETLLVLDNLEHLLDAVPALGQLVASAPDLKLLATSREPLRLYGEYLYPVPPLPEVAATELFLDRAQAVRPDLDRALARASATEICERVDRLPLAIELAAAQAAAFEPDELLERLSERLTLLVTGPRDHPERQQTLRNTLAWSHDLLASAQRTIFARLSVFAGGWTLDAAEAICGEDGDVVAGITALEEKNLVQLTASEPEPRLTMLETIREYAAEQLLPADEREVRARHADFFLSSRRAPNRSCRRATASSSIGSSSNTTTSAPPSPSWSRQESTSASCVSSARSGASGTCADISARAAFGSRRRSRTTLRRRSRARRRSTAPPRWRSTPAMSRQHAPERRKGSPFTAVSATTLARRMPPSCSRTRSSSSVSCTAHGSCT